MSNSTSAGVPPTTTCMLLVGDRAVLRADVPPEAEYLLFEIGDIELRSSEPGRVREHGYHTTVERARARLEQVGATPAMTRECAVAMQPTLSAAYARGPAVQHVSRYLGPLELFQSETYDGATRSYRGVFLDLPSLMADLGTPGAGVALQALYLAVLLEGEADETTIFLSTEPWTKQRKPGERTHKRPNLSALPTLCDDLRALAGKSPRPTIHDQLARADVIAFVRARGDSAPDDDGRALYKGLEEAIAVREIPDRGPLSEPELWAIETRLDAAAYDGILEAIEAVERTRGRTPGTTYLRARAALALQLEPPKLVAERVSALALSMTSFQELSLLAAEAWLAAGEPRRAMPYARDLVDAPGIDEGLLLRAQRLLARAVGAAPETHKTQMDSIPAAPMPPSQAPPKNHPVSAPEPHTSRSYPPGRSRVATMQGEKRPTNPGMGAATAEINERKQAPTQDAPKRKAASIAPTPAETPALDPFALEEDPSPAPPSLPPLPPPSIPPGRVRAAPPPPPSSSSSMPPPVRPKPQAAPVLPSASPPPLDLDLATAEMDMSASFTLDLPNPDVSSPTPSVAPEETTTPSRRPVRRHSMGVVSLETRAPPAFDPRAEPDSDPALVRASQPSSAPTKTRGMLPESARRKARASSPPPAASSHEDQQSRPTPLRPPPASLPPMRPPMHTPTLGADLPPESQEHVARTLDREKEIQRRSSSGGGAPEVELHGASLPPFRHENPPPLLPKAPLMPKLGGASDELAEHLALPAGLGSERGTDALPKSVLEARVAFTMLARELGLDYRLKRGIELRADVSGIEAMQAVLLESFPDHVIHTAEDAYELRRHGALLSEILARRIDAEWIDISPNELGYWAMIVPPDTRVWPFGRVARLVEMGHKERDLVSYFFELQGRARGR